MTGLSDTTTLANGVKMPWLGLGVWMAKDGEEVKRAVRAAIEFGYRSIDTAAAYANEEGVGQAIRESAFPRDQLFITTKVWNANQGYESTLAAFEESRKKLQLDYLDLYLIHWAVPGRYLDTWRALVRLYKDGRVRAIGVSNHQPEHLEDIMAHSDVTPMVNQVEFHPYLTQRPLLDFCRKHNIQLEAWSPLFRGGDLLTHPVITTLAEKYGKTPAQIILRWDLQQQVVTIPKSVHRERIKENAEVFDFELAEVDMDQISGLNANRRSFDYDPYNVNF
ncbi:aldo/keto reductase [Sulfobacillus harzensis]|uniref:aldo/keto reductase n=1 Tax=Sulfobacillus harzensis TaxID=2729629 RepID=UPI0030840D2A